VPFSVSASIQSLKTGIAFSFSLHLVQEHELPADLFTTSLLNPCRVFLLPSLQYISLIGLRPGYFREKWKKWIIDLFSGPMGRKVRPMD
jgi:hypothetical protein